MLKIIVELSEVLDFGKARLAVGNRVEDDWWVVLADVVVGLSLLIDPSESLKAGVGHIFLVRSPRDVLVLKEINHSRDIFVNLVEVVIAVLQVSHGTMRTG